MGDRKGLRFQIRAQTVRALQCWAADTLSSAPTFFLLSLHYNNPLITGTPPTKLTTLGSCAPSLARRKASEPGTHSPSTSRRPTALPVLSHPSRCAPAPLRLTVTAKADSRSPFTLCWGRSSIHPTNPRKVASVQVFQSYPRHRSGLSAVSGNVVLGPGGAALTSQRESGFWRLDYLG